jgi:hypothetical protein
MSKMINTKTVLQCKTCNIIYKNRTGLWKHNKKYHGKILCEPIIIPQNPTNELCNKISEPLNTIILHKSILCRYCDKKFKFKQGRWKHELKCKINKKEKNDKINILEDKIKYLENNDITTIKNDIKKITETYPINNQLINIIMDKNKTIEELKDKPNLASSLPCQIFPDSIIPVNILNTNNNISRTLSLNNINIISRLEDNYINAVQICQAGNKEFNDWITLDTTKYIINELETNNDKNLNFIQGIWIHPDLAIHLAQWVSPKFTLLISKWIRNLFINNYTESNIKLLKEKEDEIKLLRDICMKKQKRKNYPEKNVIYILTTEDNKKKRNYIIGKAEILKNRLTSYNKSSEHEVVYYKECKSKEHMNVVELMVLLKLDEYREKANRDRFILPIEKDISLFTSIIEQSINFY